ncbi:cytidylyltransferase [Xylaria flabelliformis]|nr:cytidylyltransferase [Xylaria flabelliformis]
MARLPSNLVARFAQALKSFESSDSTFRVLCSLPSSSTATVDLAPVEPLRRQAKYILVLDSSFNPPTLAHHRMVISALSDPRYKTKVPQDAKAEESRGMSKTSGASRVLLLLAINNADKAPKPAAFSQRLAMMYAFAQGILAESNAKGAAESSSQSPSGAKVGCEAVDIAVTTEPYFHAKAQAIATSDFYCGVEESASAVSTDNAAESEQIYLTGYDTLIRIFNPKYYPNNSMKASLDPLFALARLRVTMRTDDNWGDAAAQISYLDELRAGKLEEAGGRVEWVDRIEMVQGRKEDEAIISSTKVRDAARAEDWEALGVLVGEDIVSWIRENSLYANDDG